MDSSASFGVSSFLMLCSLTGCGTFRQRISIWELGEVESEKRCKPAPDKRDGVMGSDGK